MIGAPFALPMMRVFLMLTIILVPVEARAEATFDCVMDPALVVRLGSPVVGLLDQVKVDRGDRVRIGQVIARIESDVEAAAVEFARARANSVAEIEAQQARLALSRKRLDRASKLAEGNVISEQRMDELEAEAQVADRELKQAKLRKNLAELELARSEIALEQRTVRSPIDGIVTERHLSAGEYVHQEGHIVTLAQLDPLYVEAFLPVALYGRIGEGTVGRIRPEEPVGGEYQAKVTIVDQVFDPASGTFGVRLELPNPGRALPAGQRCRVAFDIERAN